MGGIGVDTARSIYKKWWGLHNVHPDRNRIRAAVIQFATQRNYPSLMLNQAADLVYRFEHRFPNNPPRDPDDNTLNDLLR